MYIITMSIKPTLLSQLTEFQEPKLLWESLCRSFEVGNDSRKFDLKNRLGLIPFNENAGVEAYFSQFKQTLAQLSAIGVKIDDSDLVQIVMKSLPDSYDYWLQNYTSSGHFPTLDQLQARLMLEESRRQTRSVGKRPTVSHDVDTEALYFQGAQYHWSGGRYNSGAPSQQNQGSSNRFHNNNAGYNNRGIRCFYCGRYGHPKDMCPERLADIRKLEADRRSKLGISHSANIVSDEKNWPQPESCEVDSTVPPDEGNYEVFEAALSSLDLNSSDSGWYLDSGATQHVTGNRDNFSSLEEYSGSVKTAGGVNHPIS